ncbi:MAG: exodeoxyribonuclease VII large subunit [Bacilli bacterium]|nr:exodeoxyribonuclease VII large subunit [Bacilli bacterium]
MNNNYITVGALTRYIKYKLDNDNNLQEVYLKGEISNFKHHTRGHFYFTIKDEESRISAIMFASSTKNINFEPQDGMKVLVKGRISVFEQTGNYQIYVTEMMEDGVGNLYALYEELKKKLQAEGLFDTSHKKQIPKIPNKIGVITASTGAAIKDIISTINRRYPLCEVILFPSLVQGKDAAPEIVKNIKLADTYNLDTLIVGRGGGSIEDLWAFNEEIVARAIYEANTPIISAVGHEIDFTIADFVADIRAATPTGAAEIAVPNKEDLKKLINQLTIRMNKNMLDKINYNKSYLNKVLDSYILKSPMSIYEVKEEKLSNYIERGKNVILNLLSSNELKLNNLKKSYIFIQPSKIFENKSNKYNNLIDKLDVLNPMNTLKRGYTITKIKDKVVTSIKDIKVNDEINVTLENGNIDAKVIEVKEN